MIMNKMNPSSNNPEMAGGNSDRAEGAQGSSGKSLATTKANPVSEFLKGRYSAVGTYFDRTGELGAYAEQMSDPRRPMWIGGVIIMVTFFGLGAWAAFAPLDSAAVAPGVVMVESNRRVIQHLEGGIVHDIRVQDGSVVKAGDVLISLDDTRVKAQVAILQQDLDSSLAIEARLLAERSGHAKVEFPQELTSRASDPMVKSAIDGQENVFQARKASMDGQKAILEQRIQQYKEQIVGLQALQKSKEIQTQTIKDELSGLEGLLEKGYVTKPRVLALQREAARLEGETGDHISAIARSEQGIGEAKLQIFQLEKSRQEDIAKELRDIQARIAESREKIVAADDVMRRIDLTAPVDGTVMNLQVHTKGGVVAPGAPLMEIVPAEDKLVIEAQISPMDIDTVHPGQEVAIHVSAVDSRLVPVINGTLETVSADRYTDQRTGMAYYKGRVTIPPDQIDRLGEHSLHSGMAVEAMVNRGQQTALHYMLRPLLQSLSRSFKEK